MILLAALLVITDPYKDLDYTRINVYEVQYGMPIEHPDDEEEESDYAKTEQPQQDANEILLLRC